MRTPPKGSTPTRGGRLSIDVDVAALDRADGPLDGRRTSCEDARGQSIGGGVRDAVGGRLILERDEQQERSEELFGSGGGRGGALRPELDNQRSEELVLPAGAGEIEAIEYDLALGARPRCSLPQALCRLGVDHQIDLG